MQETKQCVQKLLHRVDPDAAEELGAIPNFASKDGGLSSQASLLTTDFSASATMESLEQALAKMETKLTALLSYLAAVFEREEQSMHRHKGSGSGAGAGAGAGAAAGSATAAAAAPGKDASKSGGAEMSSRSAMLALSGKASDRVFKKLMSVEPDVSDANIRVSVRSMSPIRGTRSLESAESGTSDRDNSARDINRLISGVGIGAVVERESLKRLSAMFAERKKRTSGSPARSHLPRRR